VSEKNQIIQKLICLPLPLLYYFVSQIHRGYLKQKACRLNTPHTPLIVIGALRCGGSGKTSVSLELTRLCEKKGLRVALILNWLGKSPPNLRDAAVTGNHWKYFSDEAILARNQTKSDVYVTKNRYQTWQTLSEQNKYDLLISDDGFQDPALSGAYHIVLTEPLKKITLFDLLPLGRYRETSHSLKRADLVTNTPLLINELPSLRIKDPTITLTRQMIFPEQFDFNSGYILVCALGHNQKFKDECLQCGVSLVDVYFFRDHRPISPKKIRQIARKYPKTPLLITEKDAVKIGSFKNLPPLVIISQQITLPKLFWERILLHFNQRQSLQKTE